MPLEDSELVEVQFAGWIGMQPSTGFAYWESREALLRRLLACVEELERAGTPSTHLSYVRQQFLDLEKNFYGDFYCHHDRGAIRGGDEEGELATKKADLLQLCRETSRHTTTYFQSLQGESSNGEKAGLPTVSYLDIVGAHCSMATEASLDARTNWFEQDGRKK